MNYPSRPLSQVASIRETSDYLSNSDYYKQLNDTHLFTQTDNLLLDRLSSPRFHPTNGKSVVYLRTQHHIPDLKGSTTTLHWVDPQINKTVQLTRPIWGVHDQRVKSFTIDKQTHYFILILVLLDKR